MQWIKRALLIMLFVILAIIAIVLLVVAYLAAILREKWMRLIFGACPHCHGWKVPYDQHAVPGGVNRTYVCSNMNDPWDADGGCPWYETVFVSDVEIRMEMEQLSRALTGANTT